MKNLNFILLGLAFMGIFTFTSCGEDPEPEPEIVNIVETAQASDNLSMLVDALVAADLVDVLNGDGPFTVFAPTNTAFQDLLDTNPDWDTVEDIDKATLTSVLLFHVLGGSIMSSDLSDSYVTTNSVGPNDEPVVLQIDVTGGVKFNGTAEPVTTDVETTNGVVHIIDEVMLPPNVVTLAINNPTNFSILVAALTRADLNTMYATILQNPGPFTVFAPTDQAFIDLLNSNPDWSTLDDIPVATLEAVLNYHVIQNANVQADQLTDGAAVTTLGGSDLTIDLSDGAKLSTTSGQSVDIILTDVQGTNGVIHAIDTVLLP